MAFGIPEDSPLGQLADSISGQSHQDEVASLFQEAHTAWANYDFATVIRDLQAIDSMTPGNPEIQRLLGVSYFNLARQLEDQGQMETARQNYEAALQVEPNNVEYQGCYEQLNTKLGPP